MARLAFSQDGSRLASASFDLLAKVWDVVSGEELINLFGHSGNVFGIAFNPDGSRLATAGADGTVRLFTMRLDDLVALSKTRVTRELTVEECCKFLHLTSYQVISQRITDFTDKEIPPVTCPLKTDPMKLLELLQKPTF